MRIDNHIPLSKAQLEYIDILCIDAVLSTYQRNELMEGVCKRKVKFPDELSKSEATLVIRELKELKERQRARARQS